MALLGWPGTIINKHIMSRVCLRFWHYSELMSMYLHATQVVITEVANEDVPYYKETERERNRERERVAPQIPFVTAMLRQAAINALSPARSPHVRSLSRSGWITKMGFSEVKKVPWKFFIFSWCSKFAFKAIQGTKQSQTEHWSVLGQLGISACKLSVSCLIRTGDRLDLNRL